MRWTLGLLRQDSKVCLRTRWAMALVLAANFLCVLPKPY